MRHYPRGQARATLLSPRLLSACTLMAEVGALGHPPRWTNRNKGEHLLADLLHTAKRQGHLSESQGGSSRLVFTWDCEDRRPGTSASRLVGAFASAERCFSA